MGNVCKLMQHEEAGVGLSSAIVLDCSQKSAFSASTRTTRGRESQPERQKWRAAQWAEEPFLKMNPGLRGTSWWQGCRAAGIRHTPPGPPGSRSSVRGSLPRRDTEAGGEKQRGDATLGERGSVRATVSVFNVLIGLLLWLSW